jgi:hypothetical protein
MIMVLAFVAPLELICGHQIDPAEREAGVRRQL